MTRLFYRRIILFFKLIHELLIEIKELSIIFIINKNLSNENEEILRCHEIVARCQKIDNIIIKNELICENYYVSLKVVCDDINLHLHHTKAIICMRS